MSVSIILFTQHKLGHEHEHKRENIWAILLSDIGLLTYWVIPIYMCSNRLMMIHGLIWCPNQRIMTTFFPNQIEKPKVRKSHIANIFIQWFNDSAWHLYATVSGQVTNGISRWDPDSCLLMGQLMERMPTTLIQPPAHVKDIAYATWLRKY